MVPIEHVDSKKASPVYVFGYGSLINPKSVQKTLGRELRIEDLLVGRIHDHVRKWQLVDWVIIEGFNEERSVPAVFLDLVRHEGAWVNGILIPLSKEELHKMDQREKNYDRIDVSNLIEPEVDGQTYTYMGKKDHINPPRESCVLVQYEALVEEGLRFWGKAFEQHYYKSTLPHGFPRKEGRYFFTSRQQSRLTGKEPRK